MQGSTETHEAVLCSVLNCGFQLDHFEFIIFFWFIFYMNYAVVW